MDFIYYLYYCTVCTVVIIISLFTNCDHLKRKNESILTHFMLFQPFEMQILENSFLVRLYIILSTFPQNLKRIGKVITVGPRAILLNICIHILT